MNERNDVTVDNEFAGKAKALFDDSVAGLDAETQSKLNRGRQAALAELGHGQPLWLRWAPATGVAAAAVVAMFMWTGGSQIDDVAVPAVASDMEILLDEDSLDMLEDLEFYSWIDLDEVMDDSTTPARNVG
jgi:hypothetical protein